MRIPFSRRRTVAPVAPLTPEEASRALLVPRSALRAAHKAHVRAVARQLCAKAGQPVPAALQEKA
ncbi:MULTISPECIES: hypothetical protein [unclassified Novosphingobium]|uniref:hypothetical protein n=1 Tax=unclassified Novosphingobium TaxID=2644732 RepID=UPI000D3DA65B|nr:MULTISPECIES: hypothetical protein [unclassified Novosphingobium]PTR06414.1 hypothetical protein C8K11_12027 [Novosphingobium sp. GV055]PUA94833.1 hypothetical protein C8K12_12027 [Novosphingobium sp. GV061]PUB13758.1 hypothetical protein C8K14_12027 [Novosphingobium sp. GV079]PUB38456.1 hypothetical protein C8K10_12027 [Novosphingobium sp. GV027]